MNTTTGLYIHIPYCANECSYCDFFKEKSHFIKSFYVDTLLKDALFYKDDEKIVIDTLYFGGGTPSLLTVDQLKKIVEGLKEIFELSPECEISLETNPENIEKEKFNDFKNLGINRISIGVQSLDDEILTILSRKVDSRQILKSLEIISEIGFEHLSFDLIIGAPFSNKEKIVKDLEILLKFPFCHSSLYFLELHTNTKLYKMVKNGIELPDEEEVAQSYEEAVEMLKLYGFEHYEISNFSKKGCQCKHNLKYWKRENYIGLGPSAHSFFRGFRVKNYNSIDLWVKLISSGELPAEEVYKESNLEMNENKIIFGLRLAEGVDLNLLKEYCSEREDVFSRVEKLIETKMLKEEGNRICLTERGFIVSNEVITFLLPSTYRWRL